MMRGLRIGYGPPGSAPTYGTSGKDFDDQGSGTSPSTVTLSTQASGSSLVAFLCGFLTGQFGTPTYNGGSMGAAIRSSVYFADKWSGYGAQLHALASISGGANHVVSVSKSTPANESTLIAVEVKNGGVVQDSSIVARDTAGAGVAYSSGTVTTTGAATLVLFWTGDGDTTLTSQAAAADAGWTLREFDFRAGVAYVQAAAWTRDVSTAGTYSANITPVASQGGVIALVAIQKA